MTLQEFYANLGSDYEAVSKRIPSETMILKFVKMYEDDPSVRQLEESLEREDWHGAFRAAHTHKGVALNLGFERLQSVASELTELLRPEQPITEHALVDEVRREHGKVIDAIRQLQD